MGSVRQIRSAARLKNDALRALSTNIIIYRARAELSQIKLSAKAGLSRPVISKMEQGAMSPSIESLAKIAHVLGCSIADLFEDEPAGPVSEEEIVRRMASDISEDVDVDRFLEALEEANQRAPRFVRYSTRGRKPAVAHHRKARRPKKN